MDTNPVMGVTLLRQGAPRRLSSQPGSHSPGAKTMNRWLAVVPGPYKSSSGSCAMPSWLPPAVQKSQPAESHQPLWIQVAAGRLRSLPEA
jgi:hypothetical protein